MIKTLQEENQSLKQTIQTNSDLSVYKIALQVKDKEIEMLRKENEVLQKEIQELKQHTTSHASFLQDCTKQAINKPTTSMNTSTNIQSTTTTNISLKEYLAENTLTSDKIHAFCEEKATVECMLKGASGVAKMIRPLLKDKNKPMFVLTDQSRLTLKSKKNGEIVIDPEAKQFLETIHTGIFPSFKKIYLHEIDIVEPASKRSDRVVAGFTELKKLRFNPAYKKKFIPHTGIPTRNDVNNGTDKIEPVEEHKELKEAEHEEEQEEPPELPEDDDIMIEFSDPIHSDSY